jgi:hypothetical protein
MQQQYSPNNTPPESQKYSNSSNQDTNHSQYGQRQQQHSPNNTPPDSQKYSNSNNQDLNQFQRYQQQSQQSQSVKQHDINHLGDPLSRRHSTDSIPTGSYFNLFVCIASHFSSHRMEYRQEMEYRSLKITRRINIQCCSESLYIDSSRDFQ